MAPLVERELSQHNRPTIQVGMTFVHTVILTSNLSKIVKNFYIYIYNLGCTDATLLNSFKQCLGS